MHHKVERVKDNCGRKCFQIAWIEEFVPFATGFQSHTAFFFWAVRCRGFRVHMQCTNHEAPREGHAKGPVHCGAGPVAHFMALRPNRNMRLNHFLMIEIFKNVISKFYVFISIEGCHGPERYGGEVL